MLENPDVLARFWDDMVARPSGPFAFRFVLQPVMAAFFAVRDGVKDARTGRSPYFWLLWSDPVGRADRLKEGFSAVGRVIALSIVMDVAYQLMEFGRIYPLETLAITVVLAFLPYLILRGPANRVARLWLRGPAVGRAKK